MLGPRVLPYPHTLTLRRSNRLVILAGSSASRQELGPLSDPLDVADDLHTGAGLAEYATDLVNPDFPAFARSCGGLGIRVEREEDLDDAIRTALESDLPALVEVITDPSIHPTPTLPLHLGMPECLR